MAFSTTEGLFVQDWRGVRTLRLSVPARQGQIRGINWTQDSQRIAFDWNDRIWILNSGSNDQATPLTPELASPFTGLRARTPSWNPDGSRLFFIRYSIGLDDNGNPTTEAGHEIWTVAQDGSGLRLVHSGLPAPSQAGLAVSRDGTAVLYATGPEASPSVIWLDIATGTTLTLVANARQPAFSASGRNLSFIRNGQVWVCAYTGRSCLNEHQVSDGTNDHTPSWVGW